MLYNLSALLGLQCVEVEAEDVCSRSSHLLKLCFDGAY